MRLLAAGLFVAGALATVSFSTAQPPGGKGGEPGKGGQPGGKGGKGGFPGGPGGKGGFGMPAPGQIMPAFLQERLKLTDAQKKDLDALQKDVDAKLDKLLTEEQKKTLKEMRERGPGRGPGGPGGPGGNPPPPPPA